MASEIHLRLYEELNEFLPPDRRKRRFIYPLKKTIIVEELLTDLGVPDSEVELVLVNGNSVDFSYPLKSGDVVSLYPMFESLDVQSIVRVRKRPLRQTRFLMDAGLTCLAVYLRLLGFDTLYANPSTPGEMIRAVEDGKRILLTRDANLLKFPEIERIHLVRGIKPRQQLMEVLYRYDLYDSILPLGRCLTCNGVLSDPVGSNIQSSKPNRNCPACGRIYSGNIHFLHLQSLIARIKGIGIHLQ